MAFPQNNTSVLAQNRHYNRYIPPILTTNELLGYYTAPHSPWQNPFAERVMGTLRRECLDHIIVLNERHLQAVLTDYIDEYYNVARTHMSLNKDSPVSRPVQAEGKIASKPILGGLHHIYTRVA